MLKEGLHSIIFDNEITVYWNRISSCGKNDFYVVYLNGAIIAKTKKTHFEIFDLKPETEYKIKVEFKKDLDTLLIGEENYITKKSPVRIDVTNPPYNAVGDGVTLNTQALQKAFDDCKEGEAVYISNGTFLTGALYLHSNTEIII